MKGNGKYKGRSEVKQKMHREKDGRYDTKEKYKQTEK